MRTILLSTVLLFLLPACSARDAALRTREPRIEVLSCNLAPGHQFVDVRVRAHGVQTFDPDPARTYLLDEGTGEKYFVMRLQRVGRLADVRNPEEAAAHSILFRNLDRTLRPGARVTLVVDGMRQEHVVVGK